MTSVDNRVVQMDFDNKSFEKGVNQTIQNLDVLEKKLEFKNAGQGFANLEALANNVQLDGIANAVESINNKFSVMGVVAFNVISGITNAAMGLFDRLASGTIGTIISKGSTRALNLEQAMFQFEGLGMDVKSTMADVSAAVDGTAYSLDAAAKVAAQLGASGMRAGDDMRSSLTAISGVAAMTGSTYEDIGNVFTKVAGQGRLMGDDLLRLSSRGINAAATIAQQMGKTEAEVREMVTEGKIGFQEFSDAMSSAFGEHATRANETFEGAMSNVKSALGRIGAKFFTPFYENYRDVLNALRVKINEFNASLDPAFKVITAGMKKVSEYIQAFLGGLDFTKFASGINEFSKALTRVFNLGEDAGEAIESGPLRIVYAMKRVVNGFRNVLTTIGNVLKPVADAFKEVFAVEDGIRLLTDLTLKFELLTQKFKIGEKGITSIHDVFVKVFTSIKSIAKVIGGALSAALIILKPILAVIQKLIGYVAVAIGSFTGAIYNGTPPAEKFVEVLKGGASKIAGFIDKLTGGLPTIEQFGSAVGNIKDKLSSFGSTVSSKVAPVLDFLSRVFTPIGEKIGAFADKVVELINKLDFNKVLLGGGLMAFIASLGGVAGIIGAIQQSANNFAGITALFKAPLIQLKNILEGYQATLKAQALLTIAAAIAILAVSLLLISTIDPAKVAGGVAAMGLLMGEMIGLTAALSKMNPGRLGASSGSLVVLSIAILLLASAMKKLASLSWEEIARGSVALVVLSGVIIGMTAAMNAIQGKAVKGAASMIVIGVALIVLSEALKRLGSIDQKVLAQGFVTMVAALTALTVALNFMKGSVGGAVSMLIIAGALIVIASAIKKFGEIPIDVLTQGMQVMGLSLLLLGLAVNGMKGAVGGAVAMLIIAGALLVLAGVISILGSMPIETITQGMQAFILLLVSMVAALGLLSLIGPPVLLAAAAIAILAVGMLVAAASLVVMAIGLNMLMAAGFPAIGMLALLGVALLPLAILSPLLLLFGAGMMLMGVGLLAAGAGLVLFSMAGIEAINVLLALGIAMVPLLVAAPLMIVVGAAMVVLGAGCVILAAGLMALGMGFTMANTALPMGIVGLTKLAMVALQIAPVIPIFVALGATLIVLGAGALVAGAGLLVFGAGLVITALGIKLFSMAVKGAFTDAVAIFDEAMGTFVWHTPGMLASGAALLVFGAGVLAAGAGALVLGAGLLMACAGLALFVSVYPQAEAGFATLADGIVASTDKIDATMSKFTLSISEAVDDVGAKFAKVGPAVRIGLTAAVPMATLGGRNIVLGCINGVGSMMDAVYNVGYSIGAKAVEGVNDGADNRSPSHKTYRSGRYVAQGAINGMISLLTTVGKTGEALGEKAVTGISTGISKGADLFSDIDANPVITPVLDLSSLEAGIDGMRGDIKTPLNFSAIGANIDSNRQVGSSDNTQPAPNVTYQIYLDKWQINDPTKIRDITIGTLTELVRKGHMV